MGCGNISSEKVLMVLIIFILVSIMNSCGGSGTRRRGRTMWAMSPNESKKSVLVVQDSGASGGDSPLPAIGTY